MYIEPNSKIYILRDVPLDVTFDHSMWWPNKEAQTSGFMSKIKYRFTEQSYQRATKNSIRVEILCDRLYDCNYIMFQNTSFSNKWFYAFITNLNYLGNDVTEITYQLDPIQTWFFEFELAQSFVIREHSETDAIGDNVMPEAVPMGDYIHTPPVMLSPEREWVAVVVYTGNPSTGGITASPPGIYNGAMHQAKVKILDLSDAKDMSEFVTTLNALSIFNNTDAVADVYMLPKKYVATKYDVLDETARSESAKVISGVLRDCTGELVKPTLGTYKPVNNKLYTYPYTKIVISNNQGETKDYKYELWHDYSLQPPGRRYDLNVVGVVNPSVIFRPMMYGVPIKYADEIPTENVDSLYAWDDGIMLSNFPHCTWATSDYAAKIVQAGMGAALAGLTGGGSMAVAGGAIAGAAQDPGTGVATVPNNSLNRPLNRSNSQKIDPLEGWTPPKEFKLSANDVSVLSSYIAPALSGTHSAVMADPNLQYAAHKFGFSMEQHFIRPEYAKMIDDYFTAFGYATNRLKKPNISSRPHWNYVRTSNCRILGTMPSDDENVICDIFNHGITFWKHLDEVGNYGLDNRPL